MLHPRFITHPTYATVLLLNKKTCFIKSNKVSRNLSFWKPSSVFFLLSVCIHVMRRPSWCTKQQKMAPQVLNKSQIPKIHFTAFNTCTNPIIHLLCPPKLCIGIVFVFSWDIFMSQEKLQTMVMQMFWGVIEVYYGIVQVVNCSVHKHGRRDVRCKALLSGSPSFRSQNFQVETLPQFLIPRTSDLTHNM